MTKRRREENQSHSKKMKCNRDHLCGDVAITIMQFLPCKDAINASSVNSAWLHAAKYVTQNLDCYGDDFCRVVQSSDGFFNSMSRFRGVHSACFGFKSRYTIIDNKRVLLSDKFSQVILKSHKEQLDLFLSSIFGRLRATNISIHISDHYRPFIDNVAIYGGLESLFLRGFNIGPQFLRGLSGMSIKRLCMTNCDTNFDGVQCVMDELKALYIENSSSADNMLGLLNVKAKSLDSLQFIGAVSEGVVSNCRISVDSLRSLVFSCDKGNTNSIALLNKIITNNPNLDSLSILSYKANVISAIDSHSNIKNLRLILQPYNNHIQCNLSLGDVSKMRFVDSVVVDCSNQPNPMRHLNELSFYIPDSKKTMCMVGFDKETRRAVKHNSKVIWC